MNDVGLTERLKWDEVKTTARDVHIIIFICVALYAPLCAFLRSARIPTPAWAESRFSILYSD